MEPNYTPEEQLAALNKLGVKWHISERSIAVTVRLVFGNRKYEVCRGFPPETTEEEVVRGMHEYLRTDRNAWQAMDESLASQGFATERRHLWITAQQRGFEYRIVDDDEYESNVAATCPEAVYSVFMQVVREELKKENKV